MFEGVPGDQFHQFIAPRTSLPLHLPFPPSFDAYNQLPLLQPNILHPLHHQTPTHKDEQHKEENADISMNFEILERERQLPQLISDPSWTHDEVLALLRIRSSMESWFPELTWEHVSRKLAELGFKRTAGKCKEKFEEESRYFNNNINYSKNYRFLSELEELYQCDQNTHQVGTENSTMPNEGQDNKMGQSQTELDNGSRNDTSVAKQCDQEIERVPLVVEKSKDTKKRKRHDKFEMFKGFCVNIVNKMIAQQEEMHNKLLEDMLRRDEEKLAREEAWKKQEIDRMNKELEMMTQEQATAGKRHAAIIEFLKKFASGSLANHSFGGENEKDNLKVTKSSNSNALINLSPVLHSQNPSPAAGQNNLEPHSSSILLLNNQNSSAQSNSALPITCNDMVAAENPSSEVTSSSTSTPAPPHNPTSSTYNKLSSSNYPMSTEKEDVGRRWPRDEVLALINLRCSLNSNSNEDKDGTKALPLWERISQGMLELGYKRSAKRCKEKWENINKYFKKTKDVNKKRSLDSRTCPYFHQLSTLYGQGKLASQSQRPENHSADPPANHLKETQPADSCDTVGSSRFTMHNVDGGEKTLVQQVPAANLDFQF